MSTDSFDITLGITRTRSLSLTFRQTPNMSVVSEKVVTYKKKPCRLMVQGPDLLIKADGGAGIAGELAVINIHHHYLFLARKEDDCRIYYIGWRLGWEHARSPEIS